ncbi:MAG TPA: VCBS repeat-containing protein [Thiotrichales bacterium]|nr:VCBS repeat-containing protein [Thiotrichales bacterium]
MSIVVNSAHFPNYGTSLFLTPFINTTLDERIFDADGDGAVDIVLRLTQEFCDFNCPPELAPVPEPANNVRFVTTPADDNAAPEPAPSGIIGGNYQTADRYITFRIVQTSATQVNLVSTAVVALGSTDDLGGAPSKVDNLKLIDINGDGLGDAFYYSLNTNQWAYRLSSGTAFKSEVKLATTLGLPTDSAIRKQLRLYDVNGDGYPDMLFPSAMGSDTAVWKVSYWSWNAGGTYLAAVNTTTQTGHINNGAVTEFGDFNADSKLDVGRIVNKF